MNLKLKITPSVTITTFYTFLFQKMFHSHHLREFPLTAPVLQPASHLSILFLSSCPALPLTPFTGFQLPLHHFRNIILLVSNNSKTLPAFSFFSWSQEKSRAGSCRPHLLYRAAASASSSLFTSFILQHILNFLTWGGIKWPQGSC